MKLKITLKYRLLKFQSLIQAVLLHSEFGKKGGLDITTEKGLVKIGAMK